MPHVLCSTLPLAPTSVDWIMKRMAGKPLASSSITTRCPPRPAFSDGHGIDRATFDTSRLICALDLGCGTGALSYLVLAAFPVATVVACDLSRKMLAMCERPLARFAPRVAFRHADFATCDLGADKSTNPVRAARLLDESLLYSFP